MEFMIVFYIFAKHTACGLPVRTASTYLCFEQNKKNIKIFQLNFHFIYFFFYYFIFIFFFFFAAEKLCNVYCMGVFSL